MAAPSKRKKVEEDTGPPVAVTVTKAQRFKDEKNMKVCEIIHCIIAGIWLK